MFMGMKKMVVAKPEWFKRDNSTFLNIKMPWRGAVYYIGAAFLLLIGILLPQNLIITITIGVLFLFLILDATYATIKSMDERAKFTLFYSYEKYGLGNDSDYGHIINFHQLLHY